MYLIKISSPGLVHQLVAEDPVRAGERGGHIPPEGDETLPGLCRIIVDILNETA